MPFSSERCHIFKWRGKSLNAEVQGIFAGVNSPSIQKICLFFDKTNDYPVNNPISHALKDILLGSSTQQMPFDIKIIGTEFQVRVWLTLLGIPRGATISYGELAELLKTSPRAIGNALSRNPMPILIPCHRVVGKGQRLVGFSSGIDIKQFLLDIETEDFKGDKHEDSCNE